MEDLKRYDIYSHNGPLFTDFGNIKEYISYTLIYIYKSRGGYAVKKSGREKEVLLSPSCKSRLWLFLRTSSVQSFSPHWCVECNVLANSYLFKHWFPDPNPKLCLWTVDQLRRKANWLLNPINNKHTLLPKGICRNRENLSWPWVH